MTKRQATTLLTLLVVFYLGALVVAAPRFDLIDFPSDIDWLTAAALGALVASPTFLAIWAVHGRQRAAVRLPLTCWLLAVFYLAAAYGEVRYFGSGRADLSLLAGVAWLTAYLGVVLLLRLLRAVRGWRLERVEIREAASATSDSTSSAADERQRQFTIRALLGWTAAAAALCAGVRWLMPYHAFAPDRLSAQILEGDLIEGVAIGLIFGLASLPVVSAAWFVLADGRRTILRVVLIAITVLGIAAGIPGIRHVFDVEEVEFVTLALAIEAGVLFAGLAASSLVRACGYRLVRPSKGLQAPAHAPSNMLLRPRKFALACASLAVASAALACSAPRRFELWRQADVKQAWATLGWDVGFDASGRITRLAQLSNGDLSGSEFEIAAFGDLESLELAHSRLSDVQLAQFPIQNPGLARLKSLNLDDTPIGNAALAHLASFPGLTHLKLSRTKITDAGLSELAALKGLTRLELAVTDVSDGAVASLSRLGQLESLDLQLTAVSEEGVKRLRAALPKASILYGASDASLKLALTNVIRQSNGYGSITIAMLPSPAKRLHARGRSSVSPASPAATPTTPAVGLTDAGVALLSSRTELEDLDLRDSAVTDAGLTSLVKLTNLKRLDLRGAPVTEGGCQKLAKTLSNCEILR